MLNLTIENTYETYRDVNYKFFFVEIVTSNRLYEAWLCNDEVGIKKYMFGIWREKSTKEEFIEMVERNLDDYVTYYHEDYDN